MNERDLKTLLEAKAVRQVQVHYGVMSSGYMVVIDGKPLETLKRSTRAFKTLDSAAKFLFKTGIADFAVKLRTT